jgi:hypothetical protein
MRTALVWIFALATAISVVQAQPDQTAYSGKAVRTYSLMREDEDWSFLKDPSLRLDFWDPIKYIRLGPDNWFLTIGGETREAFEQVGNDNWGKQNYTNTFFLERYMLHTDWHLGKYVRAFAPWPETVNVDALPACPPRCRAETNAPLLVAPGSHKRGRIPTAEIPEVVRQCGIITCLAAAGDIWLYATPILHALEAASQPLHRRVLQIDYTVGKLPDGLEWLGV